MKFPPAFVSIALAILVAVPLVGLQAEQDPSAAPATETSPTAPAAVTPPPVPAQKQSAPSEAQSKGRREWARKRAMLDPAYKAAWGDAAAAKSRATQQEQLKIKELDISVAPLLDKKAPKDKKPISKEDRQKLDALKAQASKDPQVMAAHKQWRDAEANASRVLAAKIKEYTPSPDAATRKAVARTGEKPAANTEVRPPATPPAATPSSPSTTNAPPSAASTGAPAGH